MFAVFAKNVKKTFSLEQLEGKVSMYQLHKTVYLFPNDTKSEKVMRKFYEISLITSISAGPYRVVLFPNESIIVCPFKFN